MAKWRGIVGYVKSVEEYPGVWTSETTEKLYSGELLQNSSRWSVSSDSINDDLTINNRVSILSDPYAYQNFSSIKYVEVRGTKWKVTNIDVKYPRLVLTIGGVYNG